jgi:hypothetical protein
MMTDGINQVRLAEPDAAVNEKRIICPARCVGGRFCSSMRELVAGPDDEGAERVLSLEEAGFFLSAFFFLLFWLAGRFFNLLRLDKKIYLHILTLGDFANDVGKRRPVMFLDPVPMKFARHLDQ